MVSDPEEAENLLKYITATLHAAHAGRYKHSGGYRVRLAHRTRQWVLVIDRQEQWESVLQAWSDL